MSGDPARPFRAALVLALALPIGLPAAALAQGRDIEVGAFVTALADIDPQDGSFRIVLYAWFNDPAGKFEVSR